MCTWKQRKQYGSKNLHIAIVFTTLRIAAKDEKHFILTMLSELGRSLFYVFAYMQIQNALWVNHVSPFICLHTCFLWPLDEFEPNLVGRFSRSMRPAFLTSSISFCPFTNIIDTVAAVLQCLIPAFTFMIFALLIAMFCVVTTGDESGNATKTYVHSSTLMRAAIY